MHIIFYLTNHYHDALIVISSK